MRLLASLLLIAALTSNAATYYVATNGNNSASGLVGFPWLTISNAIRNAVAGDTVSIGQGIYNEQLANGTSGTAGNPITFVGTRDTNGNWLTVIDPSKTITSGWIAAPEIGAGVYKYTNTFKVSEAYINNQRLPFIYTIGDATAQIGQGYNTTNTTGVQFLTLASNAVLTTKFNSSQQVNFWDSTQALWANDTNNTSVIYLRLANSNSPNGLTINLAGAWNCVLMNQCSYINWSNVWLRNTGNNGFSLSNGANATHHCNISSNRVDGSEVHISINNYGSNNVVYGNLITANYYGLADIGSWQYGTDTTSANRLNVYIVSKFLMGQGGSLDTGINVVNCGNSNVVMWNTVFQTIGSGISLGNNIALFPIIQTNTVICYNTITNNSSIGIVLEEGETLTDVFSNNISDSNLSFRYHHMDTSGETNRYVYVHRNTCWLPDNIGEHVYFGFNGGGATYYPTYWTYHNSYSGGFLFVDVTSTLTGIGYITNAFFINNIMSTNEYAGGGNYSAASWANQFYGAFDYNIITAPFPTYPSSANPVWYGANNIKSTTNVWASVLGMSFALPSGSQAIDAALDTSSSFTIGGRTFSALPDGATKVGSAWDIGALEFTPPVTITPTMTVNQLNVGQATFY